MYMCDLLLLTSCFFEACFSFSGLTDQMFRHAVKLKLVPLSSFSEEKVTFLTSSSSYRACIGENGTLRSNLNLDGSDKYEIPYQLCIAEEDDLPDVATTLVNAFGSDVITLSGQLSPFEKALLKPGIGLINALDNSIAWVEVLSGLRARMRYRIEVAQNKHEYDPEILLSPPPLVNAKDAEAQVIAAKSSLILVLARPSLDPTKKVDIVATVDVRLQPTDAKIPFSLPWVDSIERGIARFITFEAKLNDLNLQPYISNLCVEESSRGRKLGCALVRCVERIVKDSWGYDLIYLHVDLDNLPAVKLYQSEGYEDVGFRWTPFWASNSATQIGYWCKKL